jgi:hypothetical protein
MSNKPDGGPAFPFITDCDETKPNQILSMGMTLRDYFATYAMQALLNRGYMQDDAAKRAYNTADSMLKQREQESK